MVRVEFFKNGKVIEAIKVTKKELQGVMNKCSYVSVGEEDRKNIESYHDEDIVGIIAGNIDNVFKDACELEDYDVGVVDNPDCWFVFKPEKYGCIDLDGMFSFGVAIELLKLGYRVARKGWNGKAMFLFLVPGSKFKVSRPPLLGIYPEGTEITYQPHIDMKTAQDTVVPWLASQSDVLAEDWVVVGETFLKDL